jgi:hypothetical protein
MELTGNIRKNIIELQHGIYYRYYYYAYYMLQSMVGKEISR